MELRRISKTFLLLVEIQNVKKSTMKKQKKNETKKNAYGWKSTMCIYSIGIFSKITNCKENIHTAEATRIERMKKWPRGMITALKLLNFAQIISYFCECLLMTWHVYYKLFSTATIIIIIIHIYYNVYIIFYISSVFQFVGRASVYGKSSTMKNRMMMLNPHARIFRIQKNLFHDNGKIFGCIHMCVYVYQRLLKVSWLSEANICSMIHQKSRNNKWLRSLYTLRNGPVELPGWWCLSTGWPPSRDNVEMTLIYIYVLVLSLLLFPALWLYMYVLHVDVCARTQWK